jgi:hypothetical protein
MWIALQFGSEFAEHFMWIQLHAPICIKKAPFGAFLKHSSSQTTQLEEFRLAAVEQELELADLAFLFLPL